MQPVNSVTEIAWYKSSIFFTIFCQTSTDLILQHIPDFIYKERKKLMSTSPTIGTSQLQLMGIEYWDYSIKLSFTSFKDTWII